MKRSLIVLALVSSFAAIGSANAKTTDAKFNVTINVRAGCEFTTLSGINNLAFGSVAARPLTGSADETLGQTSFDIQCTVGTAPDIALTSANGWKMNGIDADNTTASIDYALFSDSSRNSPWDDVSTVTGATSGNAQNFLVYGKVTDPGRVAGKFKDVVTVTLTY
ncbi:spore coat protein U domain-containing protein [Alcaligenaceae bacterium]|nr:spore coat protein U domain-containing protein [Alcaligenaceae bacterium]